MTMFTRLFRTAPRPSPVAPPTVEERITNVASASMEDVLRIAVSAEAEAVRAAAIARLSDGDVLRSLARLTRDPAVAANGSAALERAARARVAQLLDAGAIEFGRLREQIADRGALVAVAALCKDAALLEQILASLDDPAQIDVLVVESPSSRVRQLAADSIQDPARMRALLKRIRSKDKVVYRILKQKVDALNEAERHAAQIAAEADAVCASLERHAKRGHDALYASTLEHLRSRWRGLSPGPDADIERRSVQAIERCEQVIAAHQRQMELKAAEQAAQRTEQEARELAAREAEAAAAALLAEESRRREEANAVRAAEEAAIAAKLSVQDQLFRQIGGLIRKANEALSDGTTQRAAGLRKAIEEKRSGAPELPVHLTRGLQQLDDKLNELKQWKDYAVAPKRVELIQEMEGLIGSTEDPNTVSERIKALQQEWRTISKGIVSEASGDWERFHQASQAAYQPCQEYFAAQAKIRQDNLDGRKALIERLTAFEASQSADNPDWRLMARALREAPQAWRRHFPVEREPGRTLQRQFDELISRLKTRLDAWYERNVADKRSLITRARQLFTQDDSREAVETVKRLQVQWKETEPAPHAQEQSLWNEFREVCDAVFQKRQQALAEYAAGLETSKAKAVALCEEVEGAAGVSHAAVAEVAAKISEWRAAFDALEEMPRADLRGLRHRFEQALERCELHRAQQLERDLESAAENLFAAGALVRAYGWAVAGKADAAACETLRLAAEDFIKGVRQWPKGGLQCIKGVLSIAAGVTDTELAAHEHALRMLCIRGEILSELPSPPEDEALRREHQVQRLMQGMGQGMPADDWDAMILEWVSHCIVPPDSSAPLERRFKTARSKRAVAIAGESRPPRRDVVRGRGR